jgi:hypothetical protein
MVRCYRCQRIRPTTDFYPSSLKGTGGYSCRDCQREHDRNKRATDRAARTTLPGHYKPHWKPATEHPTMRDLAWVAGFLEGEGSFGRQYGQIYATQKNPECLYRLQRYFGGSIVRRVRRMSHGGISDVHDWTCYGPVAFGLMLTIYSFMSQRRKTQIRTAIEAIHDRRAAALANRKIWRWVNDASGHRRYIIQPAATEEAQA